ncbi:MAG: transporter related [Cryobacterium sp.]|jgi:NitT/TauT family transport system ATP-binding protein|nr:transporter related [Cryobacterium sp.]
MTELVTVDGHPQSNAGEDSIVVDHLNKIYPSQGGPVEAIRDASFNVAPGEFVSLVGPSGCGKSTLLHIVAGLLRHTNGTVSVNGEPPAANRRDVAIMLQRPVLMPWRTVLQNVLLPTEIYRQNKVQALSRAHELLEMVGLEKFASKYPWELSGGMQQRVSLVRTLVTEPQILLMDEPFAALDEFTRERLNAELAVLHEQLGRTCLYVTHHISEAVFLSDKVVVLKARPGEVLDIVNIGIERPRRIEAFTDPRATELVTKIRNMLGFADDEGTDQ